MGYERQTMMASLTFVGFGEIAPIDGAEKYSFIYDGLNSIQLFIDHAQLFEYISFMYLICISTDIIERL